MKSGESDPTGRFSGRAGAYTRFRPSYPAGLLAILERGCALTSRSVVADVGSGTGKLAELFLRNGNRVLGVEPNPDMRHEAERAFAGDPLFTSVAGRAEQTSLPDRSVDLCAAGQAFHWFDVEPTRAELSRILNAPKPVALIWNVRDETSTPFLRAYEAFLRAHGTDYRPGVHGHADEDAIGSFFGRSGFRTESIGSHQDLDLEGLRGRVLSSSYMPAPGTPGHDAMLAALLALFRAHEADGLVRFAYDTRVYYGKVGAS